MKQIARALKITPRTVAFHKYSLMSELGIKSSAAGPVRPPAGPRLHLVQPQPAGRAPPFPVASHFLTRLDFYEGVPRFPGGPGRMDAAATSPPVREKALARPRVVLADDYPDFLAVVARLMGQGYEVVGAVADGASLLCEAARLRPDAVVLDISMPGLNGIEAAPRLQAAGGGRPSCSSPSIRSRSSFRRRGGRDRLRGQESAHLGPAPRLTRGNCRPAVCAPSIQQAHGGEQNLNLFHCNAPVGLV